MAAPGFWNDQESAQAVVQQVKASRAGSSRSTRSVAGSKARASSRRCYRRSRTPRWRPSSIAKRRRSGPRSKRSAFARCSRGPDDYRDAQLEISAGAGGTEAQDWASMLMRMYTRWAERKGYAIEILDLSDGEEAGIKGAVLEIKGVYAFGFLQGRDRRAPARAHLAVRRAGSAAHELRVGVRVSGRRTKRSTSRSATRTSEMDVFRASGAGGQHVNKTSSAVRLTHLPSGIVVASQQERSQHKNKATAMKMLKNRLYQLEAERAGDEEGGARRDEIGRELRQPDSQLRLPAVHDGERPPHRAEDPRRAERHGRRTSIPSSRRTSTAARWHGGSAGGGA